MNGTASLSYEAFLSEKSLNITFDFVPILRDFDITSSNGGRRSSEAAVAVNFGSVEIYQSPYSSQQVYLLLFPPNPTLTWIHQVHALQLVFHRNSSSSFFVCQNLSAFQFNFTMEILPPPEPVPAPVKKALEVTGLVTSGFAGVLGDPVLALQQSRLSSLTQLGACLFSHVEPLPMGINPVGAGFGHIVGHYYRGAILGNFMLFTAIICFFAVIALLLYYCVLRKQKEIMRGGNVTLALAMLHFPSILMVPVGMMLQSMASVSIAILIHSPESGFFDILFGLAGLFSCIIFVGFAFVKTKRHFPLVLTKVEEDEDEKTTSRFSTIMTYWFTPSHHWVANKQDLAEHEFKQAYLYFLLDYRISYFIGVELFISLAMGIVEGVRISRVPVCVMLTVVVLLINLVAFFVCVVAKPAFVRFQQAFMLIVFLGSAFCSLFILLTLVTGDSDPWDACAEFTATIILIFCILKFVVDIVGVLQWLYAKRNSLKSQVLQSVTMQFGMLHGDLSEQEVALLTVESAQVPREEEQEVDEGTCLSASVVLPRPTDCHASPLGKKQLGAAPSTGLDRVKEVTARRVIPAAEMEDML